MLETTGSPRFLGNPCVHAALYHPGGALSHAPDLFGHQSCSSTQRCCLQLLTQPGPTQPNTFRGRTTRPTHSLSTLRSRPHDRPRKTRFRLVAHPWPAGACTRWVTNKVSASTSSPSSRLGLAHVNAVLQHVGTGVQIACRGSAATRGTPAPNPEHGIDRRCNHRALCFSSAIPAPQRYPHREPRHLPIAVTSRRRAPSA